MRSNAFGRLWNIFWGIGGRRATLPWMLIYRKATSATFLSPAVRAYKKQSRYLHRRMHCAIDKSLSANKNGRKWESLVGYTCEELRRHIEKQFLPGMTWGNRGHSWHIDHIIPKSAFNFETPSDIDFKRCWALKNLRPLWAEENMIKHAKVLTPFQPSLSISL